MPQKRKSQQPPISGQKPGQNEHAALRQAALLLAARHGWIDLAPAEIYAAAGLPVPAQGGLSVWAIVEDILASLDAEVKKDAESRLSPDSWRDNLFELLMTRFDHMQAAREAYGEILPATLARPVRAGHRLSRRLLATMNDIIETAHVPVDNARRPLAVAALAAIYLSLVDTWRQDDSADLAKTMAAVDKRVGWFEQLLTMRLGRQA